MPSTLALQAAPVLNRVWLDANSGPPANDSANQRSLQLADQSAARWSSEQLESELAAMEQGRGDAHQAVLRQPVHRLKPVEELIRLNQRETHVVGVAHSLDHSTHPPIPHCTTSDIERAHLSSGTIVRYRSETQQ